MDKKTFSNDDIESTRKLLELLKYMEEEKIKSNEQGSATIHIYALENKLNLELFLASGLNVNELSRRDKMTALQLAVAQGHKDMVKLLIAYGVDIYMHEGETLAPLFIAIQKEDTEMVNVLLECGADPQEKCRIAGTEASALAFAMVSCKMEIFEFLRGYKINIDSQAEKFTAKQECTLISDCIAISRDHVFIALNSGKVICLNHKGEPLHKYDVVSSWCNIKND